VGKIKTRTSTTTIKNKAIKVENARREKRRDVRKGRVREQC
jgi:hypothetical protein